MKFISRMTVIEKFIVAVIAAILVVLVFGSMALSDEKAKFIADCTRQEPAYQCEVHWKQMHPDPVVIYAPLNR